MRAALDQLPGTALARARARLSDARQSLHQATAGSRQPEVIQAVEQRDRTLQDLATVVALLDRARDLMGAYLDRVTGGSPPLDRGPNSDRVEQILRELPPQVPTPNPSGKKTHGRVLGEDDAEVITNGRDADARQVAEILRSRGVTRGPQLRVIEHVEMKIGFRMIRGQLRHTEIVINNLPCEGPFGCDQLLPILLPAGYSMTVHGPGYNETFHGGKKWSS
ncbi:DddA-like double-stranded DNA deaminase toxin [Actinokineospora sp. G85]|uniref:DddA-like double-stranded DNA deaminase toxin n=1 Tax=Actinokineospora sp. G85 TaxID=3406626 RepID=UPI003C733F6A